jgi:hypothetical protein
MGCKLSACKKSRLRDDDEDELDYIDGKSVEFFTFEGKTFRSKVLDVVDSNNIIFMFLYEDIPIKLRGRIYGYACPENSTTSISTMRKTLSEAAQKCKDHLNELIGPIDDSYSIVNVKILKELENGNYLIEVNLCGGGSVLKAMMDFGAKSYYGGAGAKKPDFSSEELRKIISSTKTE